MSVAGIDLEGPEKYGSDRSVSFNPAELDDPALAEIARLQLLIRRRHGCEEIASALRPWRNDFRQPCRIEVPLLCPSFSGHASRALIR